MEDSAIVDILSAGSEDVYGLYEILWGFRTKFPELSDDERIDLGQQTLLSLIERGLVQIGRKPWNPTEGQLASHELLPRKDWEDVVMVRENWDPPRWNMHVSYVNTPAGDRYLRWILMNRAESPVGDEPST